MKVNKYIQTGKKHLVAVGHRAARYAKRHALKSQPSRVLQKYARMEAKHALRRGLLFVREQIAIRPRLGLSFKTIVVLLILLAVSLYGSKTLSERKENIRINGQAVLVAEKVQPVENESEISATVNPKLSPFSYINPVENGLVSQGYSGYHRGLDIATGLGSPIKPIGSGIVEFAGFVADGKGNVVVVDHGDGLKTVYAHMGKIEVGAGNMVNSNMKIGAVGLTGRTTGPHLHLEVYDRDVAINPVSVLP